MTNKNPSASIPLGAEDQPGEPVASHNPPARPAPIERPDCPFTGAILLEVDDDRT